MCGYAGAPPKLKTLGADAKQKLTEAYQARGNGKVKEANEMHAKVVTRVRCLLFVNVADRKKSNKQSRAIAQQL